MKQYVTPSEYAKIVGRDRRTVYKWIREGIIEKHQLRSKHRIYIHKSDIPAFLRKEDHETA